VCGGYYSAFKDLLKAGKHMNVGFPIAEIDHLGECILTKERNTGGCITVGSVTSQLLYEIQGPLYYNSDVVAQLEGIKMEQVGEDKVKVWGVKGLPPPPTTIWLAWTLKRRLDGLKSRSENRSERSG
jgi:hypothetical protein